jgi:pyruvate/2-oxoglutarate dehydrogenase complex dihydrolipoamide dehydrogenase (E3) component
VTTGVLLVARPASSSPGLEGLDLPGVFFLRWTSDGVAMRAFLTDRRPRSVVIIGSGYIGLEMADALTHGGLSVTIMARSAILKTVDGTFNTLIRQELARHRVQVAEGAAAGIVTNRGERLAVEA